MNLALKTPHFPNKWGVNVRFFIFVYSSNSKIFKGYTVLILQLFLMLQTVYFNKKICNIYRPINYHYSKIGKKKDLDTVVFIYSRPIKMQFDQQSNETGR